jgi:hypothetical protein
MSATPDNLLVHLASLKGTIMPAKAGTQAKELKIH